MTFMLITMAKLLLCPAPIMYWLRKMHKTPIGSKLIVASKTCSTVWSTKSIWNDL